MANLKCFGLQQTTTPNEDDDTMVELADFEDMVQQGNNAENFLKHKIKASTNWFTSSTSPALQTYYPLCNYGKSKCSIHKNQGTRRFSLRSNKDWLAPGCIHWFSKQNRSRIRQGASSKLKIYHVLPHHQMKWVVQNQTANSYQQRKTSQATNNSFSKIQ